MSSENISYNNDCYWYKDLLDNVMEGNIFTIVQLF